MKFTQKSSQRRVYQNSHQQGGKNSFGILSHISRCSNLFQLYRSWATWAKHHSSRREWCRGPKRVSCFPSPHPADLWLPFLAKECNGRQVERRHRAKAQQQRKAVKQDPAWWNKTKEMFPYTSVNQSCLCQKSALVTTGAFMVSHNFSAFPHKVTEAKPVLSLNYKCEQWLNKSEDTLTRVSTKHVLVHCCT